MILPYYQIQAEAHNWFFLLLVSFCLQNVLVKSKHVIRW